MSTMARILIVDDHFVVRQGVRSILTARPEWKICGEAANGQEAIDAATSERPDIIVMDITMPVISGLDATVRLNDLGLTAPILFLTMHDLNALARDIRRVGARGYVQKARAGQDLIPAIDALLHGRTFFGGPGKSEPVRQKDPDPGLLHMALREA
jgi:DNA-binding NarL/FixJ family response regulator